MLLQRWTLAPMVPKGCAIFTSVLLFGPETGAVTLALDRPVPAWHRRSTVGVRGLPA